MRRWNILDSLLRVGIVGIALLGVFIVVMALVWSDTTDMRPPVLPKVIRKAPAVVPTPPLTAPELPEVAKKRVAPPSGPQLTPPDLPPIGPREMIRPGEAPLTPPQLPDVERKSLQPPQVAFLEQPQLPEVGWPEVKEFKDFRGGLDLSTCKTKVPPDRAIVLENALWNEGGDLYKRPGYSEHSTPPFDPNFLYRYYQQDGDKFTMGGSDTSLHFWHEDSSGDGWTYLIGTGGTSGRWDGTTYEDMFVGTHEGIAPVIWDGEKFIAMGESADSFKVINTMQKAVSQSGCRQDSLRIDFEPSQTGWESNEWNAYILGFWNSRMTGNPPETRDTVYKYQIIAGNTSDEIWINFHRNYQGAIIGDYPYEGPPNYAKIYSWWNIDSVWRKGTVDYATTCPDICSCVVFICDSSYYWDSTFAYDNYVFEITDGTGKGIKTYMTNYGFWISRHSSCLWDTLGFILPAFSGGCFDNTSQYKIYPLAAAGIGAKFCENFDDRLWLGWEGIDYIDSVASYEVNDSSYAGEDTIVASIDTTVVSVDTTYTVDSCEVGWRKLHTNNPAECVRCSSAISFEFDCDWPTGAWEDSVLGIHLEFYSDTNYAVHETTTKYLLMEYIKPGSLWVRSSDNYGGEGEVVGGLHATLYNMDTTGTLWREGTIDSATAVGVSGTWFNLSRARLWDDSFTWDIDTSYQFYLFTVTAGTGAGIKTLLYRYNPLLAGIPNYVWSDSSFFVPNFGPGCFDNTTQYQLHLPTFTAIDPGPIDTTFAYDTTFSYDMVWEYYTTTSYDTVYESNQNKNVLIYSELPEDGGLGNWPPENDIYLTPGDGDYITGMKSLSDARHVDVPAHLLMVTKNASSYKIIPTSTAGLYDSWYISTRVGCVSNLAMSVGEGLVLFPDQNGVWAWDQRSRPQCISLLIDPIFEAWDITSLENVSAIYNPQDRHYYLSHPDFLYTDTTDITPWGFMAGFSMDSATTVDGHWVHGIASTGEAVGADIFSNTPGSQGFTDIATDTLGRYVAIWKVSSSLWFSKFNADNEQVGDSIIIVDGDRVGRVHTGGVAVDMDNDGNIIVCWIDDPVAGVDDVWCQYVDWTDGKVDTNFVVNSDWETNTYVCREVTVGMNIDGIAVVAWKDGRDYIPETFDVYSQIYDVPDSAIGSNTLVSGGVDYWSEGDCAVGVTADRYVVAWTNQYGGTVKVQKRVFDIDGTPQEAVVDVTSGIVDLIDPATAINAAGNHVVTWSHYDTIEECYSVFAQKYDGDNVAVGGIFEVSGGLDDVTQTSSGVAINNADVFVVVWRDHRNGPEPDIYYRPYSWSATLDTCRYLNTSVSDEDCTEPEIDCPDAPYRSIDTTNTFAWNIDYRGWSGESFSASAYAYQHGLTDPVKVLFADPEETKIYDYGTQADDVNDAVILTYQSPYLSFVQNPSWDVVMSYATLEAFLGTGSIYVYWYKDYSELVHVDTISCGTDCREEIQLPDNLSGKNISMKIVTGAEIDDFTLSGYWWEYLINRCRE